MTKGPLDLVRQLATILDDLAIPYALGGSMASSLIGEPRSTVDIDIAIKLKSGSEHALLERVTPEFYVPVDAALDRYRKGDDVSDRQWRDVVGILRMNDTSFDQDYLQRTATAVDLTDLLTAALDAAAP